jgi:hypothetical protein
MPAAEQRSSVRKSVSITVIESDRRIGTVLTPSWWDFPHHDVTLRVPNAEARNFCRERGLACPSPLRPGDLTLTLGEMRDEVAWEPAFLQASAANADRYDVDEEGGLIERASGERPPHTYGFPFPEIDSADPRAGIKVMWNATVVIYKFGRLQTPFALHWIGRHGFERLVKGHAFGLAFDYQPAPLPNPERTETRDLFQALSPASVDGIGFLTWRYMDNRPDSVWGYLPSLRRVRQLTAANRSDPAYGSDITEDDRRTRAAGHG